MRSWRSAFYPQDSAEKISKLDKDLLFFSPAFVVGEQPNPTPHCFTPQIRTRFTFPWRRTPAISSSRAENGCLKRLIAGCQLLSCLGSFY